MGNTTRGRRVVVADALWETRCKQAARLTHGRRLCHSSGSQSPAFHRGIPGSSTGHVIWDLWWAKCHWGRFAPNTLVSPVNSHS
jgi:hypothetical protein